MTDRTKRFRPAPGGVSIGNVLVTAGTLGCLVYKKGKTFILSNNHVLAAVNKAEIGSPIVQPGTADGGTVENDEIAKLSEFIPISFTETSECPFASAITSVTNFLAKLFHRKTRLKAFIPGTPNTVDCAIAQLNQEGDVLNAVLEDGVLIRIEGEAEPEIGMKCKKSGRTTGTTHGEVSQIEAVVNVNMGDGQIAVFNDQFIVEKPGMCAGGDSGSAVLTEEGNKIVGLLFAGSDQTMVACRFSNVKKELGIELG